MKIRDITDYLGSISVPFVLVGNPEQEIIGYSSLYRCKPGTVVWARDRTTFLGRNNKFPETFTLLITSYDNTEEEGIVAKIMTDDPRNVFFRIIDRFWSIPPQQGISPRAIIHPGAVIGQDVTIGDGCVISEYTIIGDRTSLGCNVVTRGPVKIGADCRIQSGVVLGEDGMALVKDNCFHQPIPHYGGVDIGDRVYIGANTCVCRGTIEDTVLCDDVKVDQLCHIAHNCVLEERTLLMAGTILLGGVEIGKDAKIYSALVKEQKTMGDDVFVAHGTVVTRKLPDGAAVQGNPMMLVKRK